MKSSRRAEDVAPTAKISVRVAGASTSFYFRSLWKTLAGSSFSTFSCSVFFLRVCFCFLTWKMCSLSFLFFFSLFPILYSSLLLSAPRIQVLSSHRQFPLLSLRSQAVALSSLRPQRGQGSDCSGDDEPLVSASRRSPPPPPPTRIASLFTAPRRSSLASLSSSPLACIFSPLASRCVSSSEPPVHRIPVAPGASA